MEHLHAKAGKASTMKLNLACEAATSIMIGVLMFALFLILLSGCGGRVPLEITVAPELDAEAVKAEVIEGVAFYCEMRNLDYFRFTDNLTIDILAVDSWEDPGHGPIQGIHYPTLELISISWLGGVHKNALFHELLHREASRRKGTYHATSGIKDGKHVAHGDHPPEFYELWVPVLSVWAAKKAEEQ
jgi:hypothetical protein